MTFFNHNCYLFCLKKKMDSSVKTYKSIKELIDCPHKIVIKSLCANQLASI